MSFSGPLNFDVSGWTDKHRAAGPCWCPAEKSDTWSVTCQQRLQIVLRGNGGWITTMYKKIPCFWHFRIILFAHISIAFEQAKYLGVQQRVRGCAAWNFDLWVFTSLKISVQFLVPSGNTSFSHLSCSSKEMSKVLVKMRRLKSGYLNEDHRRVPRKPGEVCARNWMVVGGWRVRWHHLTDSLPSVHPKAAVTTVVHHQERDE